MGKDSKARKAKKRTRTPAERPVVDVMTQLETAAKDPPAAALGALVGGLVPWFGRELAHGELAAQWWSDPRLLVVAGCMLFSMLSVYKFGRAAFGEPQKAVGFVLALEGVMLASQGRIGVVALVVVVLINAICNGCTIACARAATLRRREADGRRSATRAKNRAEDRASRAQAHAQAHAPKTTPEPVPAIVVEPAARRQRPRAQPIVPWPRPRWLAAPTIVDAELVVEDFS